MACVRQRLHVLLVLCLIQWSVQLESTKQPTLLESLSNETELTTAGATTCPIGNETCATTSETPTTELPISASTALNGGTTTTALSNETTTAKSPVMSNSTARTAPVSTTTAPVHTTTAAPSAAHDVIKKVDPEDDLEEGSACTCDLMVEECESNCCCDPDCRPYQVAIFTSCLPRPRPLFDDRMCHTLKTVVVNNTEQLVEETRPGALCIVKTNIAAWVVHPSRPAILSESKFRRAWSRARSSTWPTVEQHSPSQPDLKPYVQDSFLWQFHHQHVQFVDLPSPSATSVCSARRPIRFLRPWTKHCVQRTPANKSECQQQSSDLFLRKMSVIADPSSLNRTKLALEKSASCPAEICAPIFSFNCSEQAMAQKNFSLCRNVTQLKLSSFDENTNMCYGVIKDFRLAVSHNGTRGIKSMSVYFSVTNTSAAEPAILLRSFAVDFQWRVKNVSKVKTNETIADARTISLTSTKRSGHPGYIMGKPVRSGIRHKVENLTKVNAEVGEKQAEKPLVQEKINLSRSQQDWLSVFAPGRCELRKRYPVVFGEDIHVTCGLTLTESNFSSPQSCTEIRINVLRHLLGKFNTQKLLTAPSLDTWGIVIGTFGDSNPNELSDWIPLLIDGLSMTPAELTRSENSSSPEDLVPESSKCEGVVTAMEIRFLHSLVGSINNPQSKIIGASVRFEPAQDLLWICGTASLNNECVQPLHLTTSVKFVDVSSPAVAQFAEPPGIHIRLPPDFFYPFMVAENSSGNTRRTAVGILVFSVFLMLLNNMRSDGASVLCLI